MQAMNPKLKPGERHLSEAKKLDITGYFSPFVVVPGAPCDQPIVFKMPNDEQFILVCSTVEKLEETLRQKSVSEYKIKRIEDGIDFANSIFRSGIRIMIDPYEVPGGKTRWTEIFNTEKIWHYG